jgi:DNA-binding NarL/FixJ family response regulator
MTFETQNQAVQQEGVPPLRALCIARHCFLSEHIARYFAQMGVLTTNAVGLDSAIESASEISPDVVICDYDLLATIPLEKWEHDGLLSKTPVIAVSLTRHAEELHLLDVNGIAGFLYLPTLQRAPALRILHAAAARPRYTLGLSVRAPRTIEPS